MVVVVGVVVGTVVVVGVDIAVGEELVVIADDDGVVVPTELVVTALRVDVGEDKEDDEDAKLEEVREGVDEDKVAYPPPLAALEADVFASCRLKKSLSTICPACNGVGYASLTILAAFG